MKIYQVHESGGEWDDRYDYIVASYLDKEKAEKYCEQLIREDEEYKKCSQCPLYYCPPNCSLICGECTHEMIERAKKYCERYKPFRQLKCENYEYHESSYFSVVEIEVIE